MLLLCALLLLGRSAPTPAPPQDAPSPLTPAARVVASTKASPGSRPDEPPRVLLSELRQHPLRYLHRPVQVVFQFEGFAPAFEPGPFSRFDPRRERGFRAWSDDRYLWEPDAHADPAIRLSVGAGSIDAAGLRRARRYDRFIAQAVVREVYGGVPWIAVEDLRRLPEFVGEGALIHAGRARALMGARRYAMAGEQFERATAGQLPASQLAELERLRDDCRRREAAARIATQLRRGERVIGQTPDVPH